MNLTQIALACASALVTSMAAQAVSPAGPYDTAGAMLVFLVDEVGGRTTDATLESLLKPGFYRYSAGPDYHLYLGETIATAPAGSVGFPVNQKILYINRTKDASNWVNYSHRCPFVPELLQTMILNTAVCPTAAVAGGATASCNSTAIVGQDPGAFQTGQEQFPDFYASTTHPFMLQAPFNRSHRSLDGCI